EERVFGKASVRCLLEGVYVINAFPCEAPLREQILINVRDRSRIWVDARMPGVDRGEIRTVRARERYTDPGLQNPVSLNDSSRARLVLGAVERVGYGANQQRRRVSRQDGVRVQRDHVADVL